jgi:signal transduction histidine kinase
MCAIGNQLISSDIVAVSELVKNAYDADATIVIVRFLNLFDNDIGTIEIIDNGNGMSLDVILKTWMEPATPYRKRNIYSEKFHRRVLGEKGIGRFAVSRLANTLEIVSRSEESDREIRVLFDWTQFDDDEKYLDEVEIKLDETEPREICEKGTFKIFRGILLEKEFDFLVDDLDHGTILRVHGLRNEWNKIRFKQLQQMLSRLISPLDNDNKNKNIKARDENRFIIHLDLPEQYIDYSGNVELPDVIKKPHYILAGTIDEHGFYDLKIKLRGEGKTEKIKGQFEQYSVKKPQCGPFYIEIRVWDRDEQSLAELANLYNSTVQDIRSDLNDSAGISIYRDKFRVLPYGEINNDWLRLDLRSRLNPRLRLANNQIVGYLQITADLNPLLSDQSNREGLIAGPALEDFRELIVSALNQLEIRRYKIRRRDKSKGIKSGGLFQEFTLGDIHALMAKKHPDDTELIDLIEKKKEDLLGKVKEVQEVLARYRRLASLGQLIDAVLHEGRTPLSKIVSEAQLGLRDISRSVINSSSLITRFKKRFEIIQTQSSALSTYFRRIEPFGGRKRGKPATINLEQMISCAIDLVSSEIKELGVYVTLPDGRTQVTIDQAELQEVILNLIQNSLYWLRSVSQDTRKITIEVSRISNNQIEILVSDSGPGVDPSFREQIFEPYFSTKPDGVGLGLTIAGEIIKDSYDGELELMESGPLHGATFRITLRRRV